MLPISVISSRFMPLIYFFAVIANTMLPSACVTLFIWSTKRSDLLCFYNTSSGSSGRSNSKFGGGSAVSGIFSYWLVKIGVSLGSGSEIIRGGVREFRPRSSA